MSVAATNLPPFAPVVHRYRFTARCALAIRVTALIMIPFSSLPCFCRMPKYHKKRLLEKLLKRLTAHGNTVLTLGDGACGFLY